MKKNSILNYFSKAPSSNTGDGPKGKRPRESEQIKFPAPKKLKNDDKCTSEETVELPCTPNEKKNAVKAQEAAPSSSHDYSYKSLDFLLPENIRDGSNRKPEERDYDGSTLFVPEHFLNKQTPAQRQWWQLKSANYNTILFFKMGKFYELFHMDAEVGVKVCNLSLMSGGLAHAGFPESGFERYANMLVDEGSMRSLTHMQVINQSSYYFSGYKVARIEQVETPKMMESRCKNQEGKVSKFDKVVKREICEKISCGTKILEDSGDNNVLIVIDEDPDGIFSMCVLKPNISQIYVGSIPRGQEDENSAKYKKGRLTKSLYNLASVLILVGIEAGAAEVIVSSRNDNEEYLKKWIESSFRPLIVSTRVSANSKTLEQRNRYKNYVMDVEAKDKCCIWAFNIMVDYLVEAKLDEKILGFGSIQDLSQYAPALLAPQLHHVCLDGKTCSNLDILPKKSTKKFSLFDLLNHTTTPMGRRMLKKWICNPLRRTADITLRQSALKCLDELPEFMKRTRMQIPKGAAFDLEKLLALLHAASLSNKEKSVLFEINAINKRNLNRLMVCLHGFQKVLRIFSDLKDSLSSVGESRKSQLLSSLLEDAAISDLDRTCDYFDTAFALNKSSQLSEFKLTPKPGVDVNYDEAKEALAKLESDAEEYRKSQCSFFKCNVSFNGTGNNSFQLEIPDSSAKRFVTSAYTASPGRKGYSRFTTASCLELRERKIQCEENLRDAFEAVNRRAFRKFVSYKDIWSKAIMALGQLDCLMSLHEYSYKKLASTSSCFPAFESRKYAFLNVTDGRHPILLADRGSSNSVIGNDLSIEGGKPVILTGANMGKR